MSKDIIISIPQDDLDGCHNCDNNVTGGCQYINTCGIDHGCLVVNYWTPTPIRRLQKRIDSLEIELGMLKIEFEDVKERYRRD